jgi:hypothetical protein
MTLEELRGTKVLLQQGQSQDQTKRGEAPPIK